MRTAKFLLGFSFILVLGNSLLLLWEAGIISGEMALFLLPTLAGGALFVFMLCDMADTFDKFAEWDRKIEREHSRRMDRLIRNWAERQKKERADNGEKA